MALTLTPNVGCAAGPALCVSAQLPKATSGFLGSLPPGLGSSGHIMSLGPLLGAGQHWVGWSKTFLGLFVTGRGLRDGCCGTGRPALFRLSVGRHHPLPKAETPIRGAGTGRGFAVLQGFAQGAAHKNARHCHPPLSCGSQMGWSQDYPFVPFGAEAHCFSPLPRTNSDSALHQSTMTPTQPEPFTGGSQDAHQKRGIGRAHGHLS